MVEKHSLLLKHPHVCLVSRTVSLSTAEGNTKLAGFLWKNLDLCGFWRNLVFPRYVDSAQG